MTAGEKEGRREALDRVTARLVTGGAKPEAAKQAARESMIRHDKQQEKK